MFVNVISEKSFEFAVKIVSLSKELRKNEYELARQLLRSGTSIGANVSEGQQAQSRKDFISKMSIALKEAHETKYWLKLLERTDMERSIRYKQMLSEVDEIIRILASIVKTTRETD